MTKRRKPTAKSLRVDALHLLKLLYDEMGKEYGDEAIAVLCALMASHAAAAAKYSDGRAKAMLYALKLGMEMPMEAASMWDNLRATHEKHRKAILRRPKAKWKK